MFDPFLCHFLTYRLFHSKNLFESPSKVFATAGAGAHVSSLYRSTDQNDGGKQEENLLSKCELFV